MVGFINYFLGESEMKLIKRFIKDERGLETSEYALLLALICVAIVGVVSVLSGKIQDAFTGASDAMTPVP